jgi:hypothetical protein
MTEIKDWFIRNFVNHTVPFWLFLEVLFIYGIVGIFCPLRKTLIKLMEFTREQLIADDWEVESQPVTITREDFDAAWRRAEDVCENMEITTKHYLYELVVRELGL